MHAEMLVIAVRRHVDSRGMCVDGVSSSVKSCKIDGTREMGSRVRTNQRLVELELAQSASTRV